MPEEIQIQTPADTIARLTTERDHAILRAEQAEQSVDLLLGDVENLQVALRVERRKVTMLRAEIDQQVRDGKFAVVIDEAFEYWKLRCGHPRAKLDAKRAQAVKARLTAGHTLQDVKEAIDGAAMAPYVMNGRRYDDLELICRDEPKFDAFRERRRVSILAMQQAVAS